MSNSVQHRQLSPHPKNNIDCREVTTGHVPLKIKRLSSSAGNPTRASLSDTSNLRRIGPDDSSDEGRWIPSTSLDQYAATLASWFGVPAADLTSIFPNLANFPNPVLSFMKTS